ncbi:MAG: hypothetical protein ACRDAM_17210 [Casimicrobium sp.]
MDRLGNLDIDGEIGGLTQYPRITSVFSGAIAAHLIVGDKLKLCGGLYEVLEIRKENREDLWLLPAAKACQHKKARACGVCAFECVDL